MHFTDQMGRSLELEDFPKKIISIVPSQTEYLFDLGLDEEVVGITKFCIHPDSWFRSKERVGGTKNLNIDKIRALKPDLIIGNKEENEQSQIETLMEEFPVWMSDIKDLSGANAMMAMLGAVLNRNEQATNLRLRMNASFNALKSDWSGRQMRSCAYFIWQDPFMVAGDATFINDILKICRFENIFAGLNGRYPVLSADDIAAHQPELILLSSEPFPFRETHVKKFQEISPSSRVMVVDGEMFSWYGSRLLKTPDYLRSEFSWLL
jgi:ABC-type Fe3+-hydroxamate transport system substrate-binding protein